MAASMDAIAMPAEGSANHSRHRRTLERLRDRLRDEQRDGFRGFSGSAYALASHALAVREEIEALDVAIRAMENSHD
jgi:hypothetical protein